MSAHHEDRPEYGELGIFAGYGEFQCDHIGIVSISDADCQCMDCLRVWPKSPDFKSDWPSQDRG